MDESLGAATAHIAVTNPVVMRTTNTQPGTSPLSSEIATSNLELKRRYDDVAFSIKKLFWILVAESRILKEMN